MKILLKKKIKLSLSKIKTFVFFKIKQNKGKFQLVKKTRKYSDRTMTSYYYKSKNTPVKKWVPYDTSDGRMRLNIETGELECYTRELCNLSKLASIRRSKILIEELLNMNDFDWFVTLTFGDYQVKDRNNFELVYQAYCKFIKNIRKRFPDIEYITFPEKHKEKIIFENFQEVKVKDNCYHFHMLLGNCNPIKLGFTNSGKVCCHWAKNKNGIASKEYFDRTKANYHLSETDGLTIYNIGSFSYGYSTASKIQSKAATNNYVKKYVEKAFGTTDLYMKRFFYSRNLKHPNVDTEILKDNCFVSDLNMNDTLEEKWFSLNSNVGRKYNPDYNVIQYTIDNQSYEFMQSMEKQLSLGLIPINDQQMDNIFQVVGTQLEIPLNGE